MAADDRLPSRVDSWMCIFIWLYIHALGQDQWFQHLKGLTQQQQRWQWIINNSSRSRLIHRVSTDVLYTYCLLAVCLCLRYDEFLYQGILLMLTYAQARQAYVEGKTHTHSFAAFTWDQLQQLRALRIGVLVCINYHSSHWLASFHMVLDLLFTSLIMLSFHDQNLCWFFSLGRSHTWVQRG